jgi:hypothetical protein
LIVKSSGAFSSKTIGQIDDIVYPFLLLDEPSEPESVCEWQDASESDVVFDSYRLRSDSVLSIESATASNRAVGVVDGGGSKPEPVDGAPIGNVDDADCKWVPLAFQPSNAPITRAAAFLRVGSFDALGATDFQFKGRFVAFHDATMMISVLFFLSYITITPHSNWRWVFSLKPIVEKAPLLGDSVLMFRDLLGHQDLRCEVVDDDGTIVLYDETSHDPLLAAVLQREANGTAAYQFVDMRRGRFRGVFRFRVDPLTMHVAIRHPDYVFSWTNANNELRAHKQKLQLGQERVDELVFDKQSMKATIHPEYNVVMWSMIVMCWRQSIRNL